MMIDNKTKLIGEISDLDLDSYDLDGFIIPNKRFSTCSNRYFNTYEINHIVSYCHEHNKLAILKIDCLIGEDEVSELEAYITLNLEKGIDYYLYTDNCVLRFFANLHIQNKLIYSASTLLTSFNDCKHYEYLGIKVVPSTELSYEELQSVASLSNVVITCFGYLTIFYSKRSLVTLFGEHVKNKAIKNNKYHNQVLQMVEENREEANPIIEKDQGTFIFSNFIYCLYRELKMFKPMMYYLNTYMLDIESSKRIIAIYQKAINTFPTALDYSRLLDEAKNLQACLSSGFLYKQANILKDIPDEES